MKSQSKKVLPFSFSVLIALLSAALLNASSLLAQVEEEHQTFLTATSSDSVSDAQQLITVADYAAFLNEVATTDESHLYDEKMGSDASVACIVREGSLGSYSYHVIEGQEDHPVAYLNEVRAAFYEYWFNNDLSVFQEDGIAAPQEKGFVTMETDSFLASSNMNFLLNQVHQPNSLALHSSDSSTQNSYWKDAAIAGGVTLAIVAGYKGVEYCGSGSRGEASALRSGEQGSAQVNSAEVIAVKASVTETLATSTALQEKHIESSEGSATLEESASDVIPSKNPVMKRLVPKATPAKPGNRESTDSNATWGEGGFSPVAPVTTAEESPFVRSMKALPEGTVQASSSPKSGLKSEKMTLLMVKRGGKTPNKKEDKIDMNDFDSPDVTPDPKGSAQEKGDDSQSASLEDASLDKETVLKTDQVKKAKSSRTSDDFGQQIRRFNQATSTPGKGREVTAARARPAATEVAEQPVNFETSVLRTNILPEYRATSSQDKKTIDLVRAAIDSVNQAYDKLSKKPSKREKQISFVRTQTYDQYKEVVTKVSALYEGDIDVLQGKILTSKRFSESTEDNEDLCNELISKKEEGIKQAVDYFFSLAQQGGYPEVNAVITAINESGKLYEKDPLATVDPKTDEIITAAKDHLVLRGIQTDESQFFSRQEKANLRPRSSRAPATGSLKKG